MSLVYVTMPFSKEQRIRLEASYPEAVYQYQEEPGYDLSAINNAEVIIGNVPPESLKTAANLKFFQLNSAGSNQYTIPGIFSNPVTLCNASGSYGLAISEYILTGILMLFKKMPLYQHNQEKKLWQDEKEVRSIKDATFLIIGAGDIGGTFAQKAKALGAYTIGVRRTLHQKEGWLDELYTLDDLTDLLPRADAVILSLPKTSFTTHLMDKKHLSLMKKDAILVNVGRGDCIVTEDLITALENHNIGGAVLDVTDPEPLPKEHPLWDCPNLILTPHVSGGYHLPATLARIQDLAISNLDAWVKNKPLKSLVDLSTGYRKAQDN